MKFAFVGGEKSEATKGAIGVCPSCGAELVPRCGEIKINHWAHRGRRKCDPWWENETDWHRSWKNNFPKEWQEVIHTDNESGEHHIADVKTSSDWVLEFQHSPLKREERASRNKFYPKLAWIVDGTKRKRDKPSFNRILDEYGLKSDDPRFRVVMGQDDCRLIEEWHECESYVFLDFQDTDDKDRTILWYLFPRIANNEACLWPIQKDVFIELHKNNNFDKLVEEEILPVIKRLVHKEHSKNEVEQARRREQESRMNWLKFGKRRRF